MTFQYSLPRTMFRRTAIQAGTLGLMGLSMGDLWKLKEAEAAGSVRGAKKKIKAVVYVFLSGGLSQLESFDMKPEAPEAIRGEFKPTATGTSGVHICEHLPELAKRSRHWSLVRSFTHPYNEHSIGHHVMLTGQTPTPVGFDPSKPKPSDWPSLASVVGRVKPAQGHLPAAVVLPEVLVHRTGRVIPGQFGGQMGSQSDPWFVKASPFNGTTYGAYPEYEFHHERGKENTAALKFQAPNLALPEGLSPDRLDGRLALLRSIETQRRDLEQAAQSEHFDRYRQQAVSLLADPKVQQAFDVVRADDATQERYGRNQFGWSMLMAKRLVEAGVSLVQVNLGNNEAWDNHQGIFPNLKNFLFPPTDKALAALLDDFSASGILDDTLIIVAGEFGRTPRLSKLQNGRLPGRDHWGAVQTVLLAGAGFGGGSVIGSSDKTGGYPADNPQTPENLAATIYHSLGIPEDTHWFDPNDRPHFIYHAKPIRQV